MATRTIYLEGTAFWAKVFPGQEDTKYGKKAKIDLYFTEESLKKFKLSGSRKKLKTDDKGVYATFDREVDQVNKKTGEILGFPEVVLWKQGEKPTPLTERIGNGSKVVLKIDTYDSKNGTGTRLEGVSVLELVEFGGNSEEESPYAF